MNKARVWKTASGHVYVRQTAPNITAVCLGDHESTAVKYDDRGRVEGVTIEYKDGVTVPNAKLLCYWDLAAGTSGTALLKWDMP